MKKQLDAIKDTLKHLPDKALGDLLDSIVNELGERANKRHGMPDEPVEYPDESWSDPHPF